MDEDVRTMAEWWLRAAAHGALFVVGATLGWYLNCGVMLAAGRLTAGWLAAFALCVGSWLSRRVTWIKAGAVGLAGGAILASAMFTALTYFLAEHG